MSNGLYLSDMYKLYLRLMKEEFETVEFNICLNTWRDDGFGPLYRRGELEGFVKVADGNPMWSGGYNSISCDGWNLRVRATDAAVLRKLLFEINDYLYGNMRDVYVEKINIVR